MVSKLLEREVIEPNVGPLCCNFAQWKDGSFTCDMMIGDSIEFRSEGEEYEEEFSSTYTFNVNADEKDLEEEEEEFDWSFLDFEMPNLFGWTAASEFWKGLLPGVNTALNIMSSVDII